jgi:predicted O-methyltransferase YrrM
VLLEVGTVIGYPTVDAAKEQYTEYIAAAESKLSDGAVRVVDNTLMSGEAALPPGAETFWRGEAFESGRRLNADLLTSDRWPACVLSVGDGIAFGTRR